MSNRPSAFVLAALFTVLWILSSGVDGKDFKCSMSNDRCSLPFTFSGKIYGACTTDGVGKDKSWCPTKEYDNGTADVHYCMNCWGEQRCYYTADAFPDSTWTVSCPEGCFHVQKRVYGTNNEFSADSYICAAAIHQGLITNNTGGVVTVTQSPWRNTFTGGNKNGVKTYSADKRDGRRMRVAINRRIVPLPHVLILQDKTISTLQSDRTIKVLKTGQQVIGGIACDVRKKKIYWSNPGSATIMRADYDGKRLRNQRAVIAGSQVARPELIAVDWIKGKLYWTDSVQHTISVADEDGQAVQVLIRRDKNFDPKGIALDLKNGYLYVADGGSSPNIARCTIGNSANCETVVDENIISPSGISIDPDATMFCWTDARIPVISCADLDGSKRTDMKLSEKRLKDPVGITLFDKTVYWTDVSSTIIASAKLPDWDSFHIHYGDLEKARGLLVFDDKAQNIFDPPLPPVGKNALDVYVADTTSIRRFRIDVSKDSILKVETVTSGLKKATAVAVDSRKNHIYWTDSSDKKIYRTVLSRIPNSGRTVIFDETSGYLIKPEGLAIDSTNRVLYWTDIDLHAVYVCNLDLKNNERYVAAIYIGDADYKPRGLAISPDEGLMYIADSGDPYRVQKCETKYNGACTNFIARNLQQPNWIALDIGKGRLYVSHAGDDKLFWTSFFGLSKDSIKSDKIIQPYGIGFYKNRIYVSDTKSKSVTSFHDTNAVKPFKIADGLKNPLGIFLHDPNKASGKNHCSQNTCRYLCVPAGQERKSCLCPEQYRGVSNAEECEIIPPCRSSPCKNNGRCVENARKSDYTCECPDGYGGKDCDKVTVALTQRVDPETKAIYLKCVAPRQIRSQIQWFHNKIEIDESADWLKLNRKERMLTIERPHYTHSGTFSCQVSDGNFERKATAIVKIIANIKFACGESPGLFANGAVKNKVRGGSVTKQGHAPFVAMFYKETEHADLGSGVFCGGSLITTRHVITAAHCFQKISFKEVTIYVGKHQADVNVIEKMQQSSSIKNLLLHPSYNPKSLHADYAIATVTDEFYFTSYVKPICIALPDDSRNDITPRSRGKKLKNGVVYGWGLTETGDQAKLLREIVIPILKHKACKNSYKPGQITDLMFCAGGGNYGDACKGDSGGPFTLWSGKRNRWFLGGLVSKGEGCRLGTKSKPGVYARIGQSIRRWIYGNTDLEI